MAFTQSDIDALKRAMRHGTLQVRYPDGRQVTYRGLAEMRQLLAMMEADRDGAAGTERVRTLRVASDKGW